jgi:hypothetical protein
VSVLYCHGDIFGETPVQFLLNVYLLRLWRCHQNSSCLPTLISSMEWMI